MKEFEKRAHKRSAIIFVYGEGGHRAQMMRLLDALAKEAPLSGFKLIGIAEGRESSGGFDALMTVMPLRDKHSWWRTVVLLPAALVSYGVAAARVLLSFRVHAMVSTGPGVAIPFSIMVKMFGGSVIFLETWSRFSTQSLTGRVMYWIADAFYVQNPEQLRFYPDAEYSGRL